MELSYHHVNIIMTSHRRHCVRDHRLPDSLFDCYWELPLACVLNGKEWDCTGGHNGCHGHEIKSYANNYLDVIYITSKRHPGTLPIFLMNPLSKWDKYICAQCALHIMIYKFFMYIHHILKIHIKQNWYDIPRISKYSPDMEKQKHFTGIQYGEIYTI